MSMCVRDSEKERVSEHRSISRIDTVCGRDREYVSCVWCGERDTDVG